MKKLILITALLFVSGCHRMHADIPGSGKIVTETREVGSFNSISTEGAFDIEVVCQKPLSIEIKGDDNVLPVITTEATRNVLHIKSLRSYSTSQPITLRISVPDLEGISISGAGSIGVSGMKNEKFVIDAKGAPSIRAAGETSELNIDASGAGKIDTHKLRAKQVVVNSKGVGTVDLYAAEQLDATVSGPSHVTYRGDAVVNKRVNGPGSIEKKESGGS